MAPARPVRNLSCDDSFRSAAGKIIWTRFDEMMSFRDIALKGKDIEGVHDMRVGSRRLRAAVELFRDAFPRRRLRPFLRQVKALADALGEVRDLDVMIERVTNDITDRPTSQQAALREVLADFATQRDTARHDLKATIETLEDDEFPRRFLAFVAKETM